MKDGRALKHVQVREYVRSLVSGMSPGSPAPSERELVAQFGVARMTVRQAMDALVVEGLLERIPGKGTFVARPRRTASTITSYTEEMARRGLLAESITLLARREQAGPGVARALNVTEGDPVIHWKRLRRADGAPMCIEDAFLNEVPRSTSRSTSGACARPGPRTRSTPTWPTRTRRPTSRSGRATRCCDTPAGH